MVCCGRCPGGCRPTRRKDPIPPTHNPPPLQKKTTEEAAKAAGKGKGKGLQLLQQSPDALINFRQLRVFGVQAGDLDLYDGDDITKVWMDVYRSGAPNTTTHSPNPKHHHQ